MGKRGQIFGEKAFVRRKNKKVFTGGRSKASEDRWSGQLGIVKDITVMQIRNRSGPRVFNFKKHVFISEIKTTWPQCLTCKHVHWRTSCGANVSPILHSVPSFPFFPLLLFSISLWCHAQPVFDDVFHIFLSAAYHQGVSFH